MFRWLNPTKNSALLGGVIAAMLIGNANALVITPLTPGQSTTNNKNLSKWSAVEAEYGFNIDPDLVLLYKAEAGSAKEEKRIFFLIFSN